MRTLASELAALQMRTLFLGGLVIDAKLQLEGPAMTGLMKILALALPIASISLPALAQPAAPNIPPPRTCALTPAQVAQGRQAVLDFFRPGITPAEQTALLDPNYIQHNPRFQVFARERGLSDYAAFPLMRAQAQQTPQPPPPAGRPANEPFAHVLVDCDMVTVLHKVWMQTPGAAPGTWYEAYTFDTFKVSGGKMLEHWDAVVLPPAAAPAGSPGAR